MHTFTKTCDSESYFDSTKVSIDYTEVTVKTSAEQLTDIISAFEDYLRGCGFHFDGRLELVDDDTDDLPGEDA